MADGPDDFDGDDGGNPEDGPILSPEELDIADDEHVTQLDESRFVVSSEVRTEDQGVAQPHEQTTATDSEQQESTRESKTSQSTEPTRESKTSPNTEPESGDESTKDTENTRERMPEPESSKQNTRETTERGAATHEEVTREAVHRWLRESFAGGGSRYGFDVTATFDGSISQRRMASNDVVTIFESLVLWYAQQIDSDTPVEEILGILLMEANVPVRYPPESFKNAVKSTGLGPDDTIADLLAAVDEDDGVEL